MKLPRNVSGEDLIKALRKLGYEVLRQRGSHIRLKTSEKGEHYITIPNHSPLKAGTFSSILAAIAEHHEMTKDELVEKLFGK